MIVFFATTPSHGHPSSPEAGTTLGVWLLPIAQYESFCPCRACFFCVTPPRVFFLRFTMKAA